MTKIEKIYCEAANELIDVEEEKTPAVINRVSKYVYDKHGYNAADETIAHDALIFAMDWFFYNN